MDSFKFHDIKAEKANATSMYNRIQRITTLLIRFLEVFVLLIVVSRFSTQLAFSIKLSGEWISVTLISPRFVFLIGNAIVLALFLTSGKFSSKKGESSADFYDEYVEKCRINNRQNCAKSEKNKSPHFYRKYSTVCNDEKMIMSRSQSEIMIEKSANEREITSRKYSNVCNDERKFIMSRSQSEITVGKAVRGEERRRDLSESRWKSVGGGSSYAEDEMSGEEFRRTVEAFIARQQRVLREEEAFS